jgi:hypothetical protein
MTIDQAAAALGVSRATVRRRLRNGGLTGTRVPTPQGFVWEVTVDLPTDSADGESPPPQPTPQADEGARLRDEHIADLRRRVEDQAREIAELHRLLAQAQQHLLTAAAAAESPGEADASAGGQKATPRREEGGWLRGWVRRLQGGSEPAPSSP